MVLIRAMNMFAIAGGVLAVERMVEHKTAASGSGGAAAAAAGVVMPDQIEELEGIQVGWSKEKTTL